MRIIPNATPKTMLVIGLVAGYFVGQQYNVQFMVKKLKNDND